MIPVGSNTSLTCTIYADHAHQDTTAIVEWRKNNASIKPILPSFSPIHYLYMYIFSQSYEYSITSLSLSQAGLYVCRAKVLSSLRTPFLMSSEFVPKESAIATESKKY